MEFQFCVYYSREIDYVWSSWVLSCLFDLMSVNAWNLWQTDARENCFLLSCYDLEEPVCVKLKWLQVYVATGQWELFLILHHVVWVKAHFMTQSEEKQNREADAHVGLKVAQLGRCHLTEMKAMSLCSREHYAMDCCEFSNWLQLRVSADLCDRQSEHWHNSLCRNFAWSITWMFTVIIPQLDIPIMSSEGGLSRI